MSYEVFTDSDDNMTFEANKILVTLLNHGYKELVPIIRISSQSKLVKDGRTVIVDANGPKVFVQTTVEELTKPYTILTKPYTIEATNSEWSARDIIGEAAQRGMQMTEEQAQYLLEDNEKDISEYGWDAISNVLDEVDQCHYCQRAVDVADELDDESCATVGGGRICYACRATDNYKSCGHCEQYDKRADMVDVNPNGDEDLICHQCQDLGKHGDWRDKQ